MEKCKKVVWLVIILLTLSVIHTVKGVECDDDEECKPILSCPIEFEYFKRRDFSKLKICGLEARTDKHCCKIVPELGAKTSECKDVKNSITSDSPIKDHPNFHLINQKCGSIFSDRIVGGTDAKLGQFPWMALLMYRSNVGDNEISFKCGGSLITPKHVLTAAHCLKPSGFMLFAVRLGEFRISTAIDCSDLNDPDSCSNDDPQFQDIEIEKAIPHENFSNQAGVYNDIALLILKSEAKLKKIKNVKTICLPVSPQQNIEEIKQGLGKNPVMQVSGWGRTEKELQSDVLLYTQIPYMNADQCEKVYKEKIKANLKILETQLCVGGFNHSDSCSGDSGSPLIYPAPDDKGKHRMFQYGVVSFGTKGCSQSILLPGIYTRVSSFMKWILDNLTK